jgi:hypothetical protein
MSNLPPSEGPATLTGSAQPVAALTSPERERMFRILCENFDGTTRHRFECDLAEKEWVILLCDQGGTIQGFSTLMQLETRRGDAPVTAFFSGDTIIRRPFWGQTVLPRLWSRHVFSLAAAMGGRTVYWFLICSGYKTYRFLPVFFREFYPRYDRATPGEIRALMDTLGRFKYPREYDAASGVVRLSEPSPLKEGIADITSGRLRDPHVAFFQAANPGHVRGDELVCITEISPANVTVAGSRMLGGQDTA